MAVSQSQIVDLLYKQAFGVTKTDTANIKSPSNESIASPLLIRGDTVWVQSGSIPGVAANVSGIVQGYTGASAVQCAADTTTVPISGVYPTWLTNLTDWIPQEFGATYVVKVYVDNPGAANPTATGTQIFADGSGGSGQYYYNYVSGVLNFIGETIPAALTSGKVLYVVGYRYVGIKGISGAGSTGNITFSGDTISTDTANANITISANGTGQLNVTSSISASGNVTGNYFVGNGAVLTSVLADRGNDQNNWDTLTQMGVYTVNRLSWSGTQGTPLDSQIYTGILEVKNTTNTGITQVFYPGTVDITNPKIQWNRSYWSGSWTAWYYIVNDIQTVEGGLF